MVIWGGGGTISNERRIGGMNGIQSILTKIKIKKTIYLLYFFTLILDDALWFIFAVKLLSPDSR